MSFIRLGRKTFRALAKRMAINYTWKRLMVPEMASSSGRFSPRERASRKCPRPESNQGTRFRKPLLYPLSYGGLSGG